MRQLLSVAVSAALLSTAACTVAEPVIIRSDRTAPPVPRPASTKAAAREASDEPVIPEGWSLVTSAEGGFRAAFPSPPEVKEQVLKTDSGVVRTISYGVPVGQGDSYLLVMVGQYPEGAMSGKPADALLKTAGDFTLAQNEFTRVSEKASRVEGARGSGVTFPCRDVEATGQSSGKRISIRMLLVRDRVYQILFMRDGEQAEPFHQFLSTFSLR